MSNHEPVTISPLIAIRDKERALAQAIESAQEAANAKLAAARARSEELRQQAEREGQAAADAWYQEGLKQAQAEAAVLVKQGEADAVEQRQAGLARMDVAVNRIVSFVLPHAES